MPPSGAAPAIITRRILDAKFIGTPLAYLKYCFISPRRRRDFISVNYRHLRNHRIGHRAEIVDLLQARLYKEKEIPEMRSCF